MRGTQVHARPQPHLLQRRSHGNLDAALFGIAARAAVAVEHVRGPVAARREIEFAIPLPARGRANISKQVWCQSSSRRARWQTDGHQAYGSQVAAQLVFDGERCPSDASAPEADSACTGPELPRACGTQRQVVEGGGSGIGRIGVGGVTARQRYAIGRRSAIDPVPHARHCVQRAARRRRIAASRAGYRRAHVRLVRPRQVLSRASSARRKRSWRRRASATGTP